MRIAITGATGFIGHMLANKLAENGHSVRILTRKNGFERSFHPKISIFEGDLLETNGVLKKFTQDIDILYHCAAEINNKALMWVVNVNGTENLIQAASGQVKHWIQLSSTGVYGNPLTGIIDEESPTNPQNEYEISKLEADRLVMEAGEIGLFKYTIIRPSNVFGQNMRNQSIFQLIYSIQKGRFRYIGKRGASANYIPVGNVIEALMLLAQNKKAFNQLFILSDWCTIEAFVTAIAKELKVGIPLFRLPKFPLKFVAYIVRLPFPNFPLTPSRIDALTTRCKYNCEKITNLIGYQSPEIIEEELKKMVVVFNKRQSSNVLNNNE